MSARAHARPETLSVIRPLDRSVVSGSLHDRIYAALCQALMVGDLVPGQTFSIRSLAARFGTSLIPVRDALRRLFAEHALGMQQNRTFWVPKMTRRRFQELLQIRLSLETMLAQRSAELITETAIRELEAINAEMQDAVPANQVRRYLIANQRFHFHIYRIAESHAIFPIVESLWMQVGPFLNGVFTAVGTRHARDNHTQVLKALRRRDAIGAAEAIRSDLADAADVILARDKFVLDDGPAERPDPKGAHGRAEKGRKLVKRTEEM
ncbi:MAG: GntR family transcriptional regulator [Betaproteobacteria bacterium]|nr:MAG: GntR family transcriptional regulator [Betaproteobacteria bacterium]